MTHTIRVLYIAVFAFICSTAFADEDAFSEAMEYQLPHNSMRNTNHFIGLRNLSLSGVGLQYSYRLDDQVLIGLALSAGGFRRGDNRSGDGNLAARKYFAQDAEIAVEAQDVNLTYFVSPEGYRKSGFLARGGIGTSRGSIKGRYYRYDEDPGVFRIGDGKRLQEKGPEANENFSTRYARVGGYYQVVWPSSGESTYGATNLEIGGSVFVLENPPSVTIARPDGSERHVTADRLNPSLEVAYGMAF